MSATHSGGGSMDYEYAPSFHDGPSVRSGRPSRCPAMAPFNALPPSNFLTTYDTWHAPQSIHALAGQPPRHAYQPFGFPGNIQPRASAVPNPVLEPRVTQLTRVQDQPAFGLHSPSAAARPSADMSLSSPSPSLHPPLPPGTASAAPTQSATRVPSDSSSSAPSWAGASPVTALEPPASDANSSLPSHPQSYRPQLQAHSQSQSQSQPVVSTSTQRDDQSSQDRPAPSQSLPRVQLPAPNNNRPGALPDRAAATLGHLARYRELANQMDTAEYEAAQAAAAQISDDDSDRDIATRPNVFGFYGFLTGGARQTQLLRGRMNGKRVASKKAISSLEKVDVDSLEDTEKTCVICYNRFGVASPEGTTEIPLRLPKCKHVFGDNCILKWLQESHSCPYCRDKLESEMARPDQETIRRMVAESDLNLMPPTARRLYRPHRFQASEQLVSRAESLLRAREREITTELSRDSTSRGERRAAPAEDVNDAQRRQRPRFSGHGYTQNIPTGPAQSSARDQPVQRTPAWQQGFSNPHANHWPIYSGSSSPPSQSQYQSPPFAMSTAYYHLPTAPGLPPIHSREDWNSVSGYMGLSSIGPLSAQVHASSNSQGPSSSAPHRHLPSPGEPFSYASRHNSNPQSFANVMQPSQGDQMPTGSSYPGSPNRNY